MTFSFCKNNFLSRASCQCEYKVNCNIKSWLYVPYILNEPVFYFKNRDGVTSANCTTFGMFGSMIFIITKKEDYYNTSI